VEALGGQKVMSEEVFKAIVARLEDSDGYVRRAAVEALEGEMAHSEEVVKAIVARLEDSDGYVRRAAVQVLGGQKVMSEEVLSEYLKPLYGIWLNRSFEEHLGCWVVGDGMCIVLPEGFRKIQVVGQDQLRDAIGKTQKYFGIPPHDT
jgi:hypothetical protein